LYSDNQALQFITRQDKFNQIHDKWVEFMHNFNFFIKHISGSANKVLDALSRRCLIMHEFKVETLGFEYFKEIYRDDTDFKEAYKACENPFLRDISQWMEYLIQDGLLFKWIQLCILKCTMRYNTLKENTVGDRLYISTMIILMNI
jgi:hypothetical protein